jgi:hypothetical protein
MCFPEIFVDEKTITLSFELINFGFLIRNGGFNHCSSKRAEGVSGEANSN